MDGVTAHTLTTTLSPSICRKLAGDPLIYLLYDAAQAMHTNYYDDAKQVVELRVNLRGADDLLRRLAAAERQIGPNPPAPTYTRQSR